MKKSILLTLAIPMLLAGCNQTGGTIISSPKLDEETSQTGGKTETQTGGDSEQGTEGSTTGGGTETGGGTGGQEEITSLTISKDVNDFDLANGNKPSTLTVNEDITITCDVGANSNKNAPAYYESDFSLRFYPKNTLKFSSSLGPITRLVLSANGNSFSANNLSFS